MWHRNTPNQPGRNGPGPGQRRKTECPPAVVSRMKGKSMPNNLMFAFGMSIVLVVLCVWRFLFACWQYNAELRDKSVIMILVSLVLCAAIGCYGWFSTEHCPNCNAAVTSSYCEQCGQRVDAGPPTCPSCGEESDTPYCGSCGAEISK